MISKPFLKVRIHLPSIDLVLANRDLKKLPRCCDFVFEIVVSGCGKKATFARRGWFFLRKKMAVSDGAASRFAKVYSVRGSSLHRWHEVC